MQMEVVANTLKMILLLHTVNIIGIIWSLYESLWTQSSLISLTGSFLEHKSTGACVRSMRRLLSFWLRLMNNWVNLRSWLIHWAAVECRDSELYPPSRDTMSDMNHRLCYWSNVPLWGVMSITHASRGHPQEIEKASEAGQYTDAVIYSSHMHES